MIKGRKIRGIIVAIALIICTAVSVAADSSKGWNIEHKSLEANFYGNVSFSRRNGLFKSVITYFAHIGGTDKDKVQLSVDSNHTLQLLKLSSPLISLALTEVVEPVSSFVYAPALF